MQAHILDREHTACVTQPAAGDDAPLLSFAGHIARPVSSAPLRVRVLWAAVVIMINPHHQPFPPRISSTHPHPPFLSPLPPFTSHHAWLYTQGTSCLAWAWAGRPMRSAAV